MTGQLPEVQPPQQFPNLLTGELVDRSDMGQVVGYLDQLNEHRRKVSALIREIGDIVIEHARTHGTKTIHAEVRLPPDPRANAETQKHLPSVVRLKAVVSGGPEVDWDVSRLEDLLQAGLPQDRWNELVSIEQTFKINANVAKSIAASNPAYAEIIESAKGITPKPERVRVVPDA